VEGWVENGNFAGKEWNLKKGKYVIVDAVYGYRDRYLHIVLDALFIIIGAWQAGHHYTSCNPFLC
jgi:hypothetical protein